MTAEVKPKKNIYRILLRWCIIISAIIIFASIIVGIAKGPDEDGFYSVEPTIFIGIILAVVGSFLIAIVNVIDLFRQAKRYNRYLVENNIDEKAEEEAFKDYINSTRHNQAATGFRELSQWLRAMKNTPKDKSPAGYFNLVMIILFLGCCIAFVPLLACGLLVASLSVLGAGFGIIILLLVIHIVHKRIATSHRNIDYNVPRQTATVTGCMISDESTFSTGSRYYTKTNRILSTTYLVYLDVDGVTKRAYSKTFYNKGTTVYVYPNRKLHDMVEIDEN